MSHSTLYGSIKKTFSLFIKIHRAITADIIAPLPQLIELRLDGNDIAVIERNALISAKSLKILSLHDNPLACDCKRQYFAEWLSNTTPQISTNVCSLNEI